MNSAEPITPLVDELDALTPGQESAWIADRSDASSDVRTLCLQIERLIIGDLKRATHLSERLVRLADAEGEVEPRAAARRIRAQALAYANNLEQALGLLGEASDLLEDGPASVEVARVQLATLHSLARMGRHAEGIAAGVRARDAFERSGDLVQAARAEINIGAVERMRGEPRLAIEAFARARGALNNEALLRAQLESNCAEALLDLGRFDEATRSFRESLRAFEAAGLERAAAIVEGNLADLFARQGLLEPALRHFEHAQRRFGSLAAPGDAARIEVEYADALASTGLRDEAIDAYAHALPVLREHKLAWEVIRGELGLGRALLEEDRIDEAEAAFARAELASTSLENRTAMSRSLHGRARARDRRGDAAGARALLTRAEALTSELPVEHLRVRLHLAITGRDGGARSNGSEELDAIVRDAEALGVPPLLGESLHVRARYRRATRRLDLAIKDYRAALGQAERTRGMLQADRFRAAFAGDRDELYEECIGAVLDRDDAECVEEAFALVERSKSRSLLDVLQPGREAPERAHASIEAGEGELIDELSARRADLNALYSELDMIGRAQDASRVGVGSERWSERVSEQERQISRLERRLAAARPRLGVAAESIGLQDAMRLLDSDTALVEYFSEAGMASAIVCDGRGRATVCRSMCSMDDVRDALEELHFQVSCSGEGLPKSFRGRARDVLERLHSLVLDPLEEHLVGVRSLVVVPTGALNAVPFPAIWGEASPLCARCRVVQAPSASILAQLASRQAATSGRGALVVGLSDEFAPRSEDEARAIAALWPEATLLLGKDATRANVLRECREKKLIHIATHGRFLARNPSESGVRLADGWLTTRDAHDLRLNGAHVTLSACDTGRVLAAPAGEAWGLVRGFLAGGAGSLILSLWALHDESASEMMSDCYLACRAGTEVSHPAESLRQAMLKECSAGADPLLWAPFVYIGAP